MVQDLMIYSDGGARGNPGPAAIAFLALDEHRETITTDSKFIGLRTNNQAEYEALLFALQSAVNFRVEEVVCHLDSELVVKQLNGQYAVKSPELQLLWRKVGALKKCFRKISFVNVPREHPQIQQADAMVNAVLNQKEKSSKSGDVVSIRPNAGHTQEKNLFVHTSIRTSNMKRSIDFYSRFLGLKLQSHREISQNNAEIAFLQDPDHKGSILELTFYRNQKQFVQAEYEARIFDHLGFEVANIEKTVEEMRKAGITITDEPFALNSSTTIAFVEDPDGTLIELIQRK
jgi:ribonuclease HI